VRQLTFTRASKLEWREVEPPRLETDEQALVRPVAVATCDLDLALIRGRVPVGREFAFGHEGVAEVLEVGDSVHGVAPGELVSVPFQISCGHCGRCRKQQTGNCESVEFLSAYGLPLGPDNGGLLSDVVRVPFADAMLVAVPEAVEPASVASLSDNIPDAWRTVAPQLEEYPGARVLICAGAGSIALYAGSIALALGASGVDFAGGRPGERELAARLGITLADEDFPERMGHYPITVDASADRAGLQCALRSTEADGICTSIGIYFEPETPVPLLEMYTSGIRFHTGRVHARPAMEPILELVRSGRFEPEAVTRERAGWEDAAEAVASHSDKLVISRT
jgi:alcohol dehydrogenase